MGDRFDAKYLKDIDSMHFIMPFMYPDRCDNQAFFSFQIDLTNLEEYIKEKNKDNPDYRMIYSDRILKEVRKDFRSLAPLHRLLRGYVTETTPK